MTNKLLDKHYQGLILSILLVSLNACSNSGKESYESYYPNSTTEWEGTLLNGLRVGEWIMFDSLGNKLLIYRYENDSLIYREHYENSVLFSSEHLKDENTKHGETTIYFRNGVIKSSSHYVDNREIGDHIDYYENKQIKISYFQDSLEMRNFKQYYPNGSLFAESETPENGIVHFYDSLGNRTADIEYSNFVMVDTVQVWQRIKN